jgi:hypothetical protein
MKRSASGKRQELLVVVGVGGDRRIERPVDGEVAAVAEGCAHGARQRRALPAERIGIEAVDIVAGVVGVPAAPDDQLPPVRMPGHRAPGGDDIARITEGHAVDARPLRQRRPHLLEGIGVDLQLTALRRLRNPVPQRIAGNRRLEQPGHAESPVSNDEKFDTFNQSVPSTPTASERTWNSAAVPVNTKRDRARL